VLSDFCFVLGVVINSLTYLLTYLPLKVYHIDELANLLDSVCNWRCVADKLGLSDDEKLAVEAGTGTVVDPKRPALRHVPTVDVLRLWRTKPRSTVRVLRQVLATVASDELVQQLDRRRMSKYRGLQLSDSGLNPVNTSCFKALLFKAFSAILV